MEVDFKKFSIEFQNFVLGLGKPVREEGKHQKQTCPSTYQFYMKLFKDSLQKSCDIKLKKPKNVIEKLQDKENGDFASSKLHEFARSTKIKLKEEQVQFE